MHFLNDGIVRVLFDDNPDPQVLRLECVIYNDIYILSLYVVNELQTNDSYIPQAIVYLIAFSIGGVGIGATIDPIFHTPSLFWSDQRPKIDEVIRGENKVIAALSFSNSAPYDVDDELLNFQIWMRQIYVS
ncbi:MAG: hypothetical protein EZS28_026929 [Streblomastix strix]|uniref:Uncharacterized protein n=1 Tax=Streblomastix strix TaxID=222440 RepID=A0A5J4V651_9EUKA|nr:MAG: hypothetical protein EZS28_026929 [Streblomastix strix]